MARLSAFRALFSRATAAEPAPVAEVAADRQAAGTELLAAQRAVEKAEAAYSAGLLDIEADLPALNDGRRDAAVRLDRAKALIRAFDEQHVAAQAAERQAELDRVVAEADAAQAVFRDLVENDMPAIGTAVRGLLRAWAEAEIAREAANRAIATAGMGEPRPPVEAFRASGGRPARTLRTEQFEGWCGPDGELSGYHNEIKPQSDGSGFHRPPNATHSRRYRYRRRFERTEILAAEPARIPTALAEVLAVPGLRAGDGPMWEPIRDPTPARVFAALDTIERQSDPDVDPRQPRVVVRAVGPVIEVAKPSMLDRAATG